MSEGLFYPRPFLPSSSRLSSSSRRRLFLSISHSLLGELFRPRESSLSISTVIDVSVETKDPTTPPANHATTTPPFLGKAKRKQIMAQSSRELQASLILLHPGFFDLICFIRILIPGI